MATVTAFVEKAQNENTQSLLRRFTRRVQGSKILNVARGRQYSTRELSDLKKKRSALRALETGKKIERLKKLGKFVEKKTRRRR